MQQKRIQIRYLKQNQTLGINLAFLIYNQVDTLHVDICQQKGRGYDVH